MHLLDKFLVSFLLALFAARIKPAVAISETCSFYYEMKQICDFTQRIENGCVKLMSGSDFSPIQCAVMCQENFPSCIGVDLNDAGNCYLHFDCGAMDITPSNCSSTKLLHYERSTGGYDNGGMIADNNRASGWTGERYDILNPLICQNGGTPTLNNSGCECPSYWKGNKCEIPNHEICQNGGALDTGISMCVCPPLWTGKWCDIPEATTCLNGGILMREPYMCICIPMWTGSICNDSAVPFPAPSPCNNTGTSCPACPRYWMGSNCDQLPQSCIDIKSMEGSDGVYWVNMRIPNSNYATKVKCEIDGNVVYTHISYNNGSSNYNATYQEYQNGFYRDNSTFWLGLENMYNLNRRGLSKIGLKFNIRGEEVRKHYTSCLITKEQVHDYQVYCNSSYNFANSLKLMIGNCFSSNSRFSTWDHDVDGEDDKNIAALAGSGWWYGEREERFCNVNGKKPIDSINRINNIAIDNINMTFNEYGKSFQHSEFYFIDGWTQA